MISLGETEIRLIASTNAGAQTASPGPTRPEKTSYESLNEPGRPEGPFTSRGNLESLTGTTLLRCNIESPLARGKSGIVFRATDRQHKRPVALKILWPSSRATIRQFSGLFVR